MVSFTELQSGAIGACLAWWAGLLIAWQMVAVVVGTIVESCGGPVG